MISRDAVAPLVGLVLVAVVMSVGTLVTPLKHLIALTLLCWALVGFALFFFRDPQRQGPRGSNLILAPADGKVIGVKEVAEDEYLKGKSLRISIFLSIFDVHVNRSPISGVVEYFRYRKGDFRAAFKEEAAHANEQTVIGIRGELVRVLVKQIAGALTRRIICSLREGRRVEQGERFGMIRFGSRTEVYVPPTAKLLIQEGQKVRAGVSVLATVEEA